MTKPAESIKTMRLRVTVLLPLKVFLIFASDRLSSTKE